MDTQLHNTMPSRRGRRGGFTLIEMLVVLAIILLIAGITLPSIVKLFDAGAEEQSYNILSAQLTAARALAISENTYTAVHIQRADATDEMKGQNIFYSAILRFREIRDGDAMFFPAEGFPVRKLPAKIGVIDVEEFTTKSPAWHETTDGYGEFGDFRTVWNPYAMTIVFAPDGRVVRRVYDKDIKVDPTSDLVMDSGQTTTDKPDAIWNWRRGGGYGDGSEGGRTMLVLVNSGQLNLLKFNNPRSPEIDYLNENGLIISVNRYTGQLFPRE